MKLYALAVSALKQGETYVTAVAYWNDSDNLSTVEQEAIHVAYSQFPASEGYTHHSVIADTFEDDWIVQAAEEIKKGTG